jgi:hypothetical protein
MLRARSLLWHAETVHLGVVRRVPFLRRPLLLAGNDCSGACAARRIMTPFGKKTKQKQQHEEEERKKHKPPAPT